jgi:hypothetical protein
MPDEKPQGEKLARRERNQPIPEEEDLRVKARYVSDEERRAKIAEEESQSEKYIVTEATPSSGGVYPPSAVVDPFPPDVVATHTPGEQEPEQTDPQTAQLRGKKADEPAAHTTPAS